VKRRVTRFDLWALHIGGLRAVMNEAREVKAQRRDDAVTARWRRRRTKRRASE
jgi:hypothetical protein